MKKYIFILSAFAIVLTSCSKEQNTTQPVINLEAQAKLDDDAIVAYLNGHPNILATKDDSGLYYQVLEEGSGATISSGSKLTVSYTGKDLNDVTFETKENLSFILSQVISGWQIGLPKIKNGGKIVLVIPSLLAYGPYANGQLPANSNLVFTITVKSVDGVASTVE